MALVMTGGPIVEPVSLDEAKAHLRIDDEFEDVLIASLITAARVHLETRLGQAFITQSWSYLLDDWPKGPILPLPLSPLQGVAAVRLYDANDQAQELDASRYALDALSQPPRLVWRGASPRPQPGRVHNGIEIELTAGFGAASQDVPQPLRQAILLLVAHWHENRESVPHAHKTGEIPQMVNMLIHPYQQVRLS